MRFLFFLLDDILGVLFFFFGVGGEVIVIVCVFGVDFFLLVWCFEFFVFLGVVVGVFGVGEG